MNNQLLGLLLSRDGLFVAAMIGENALRRCQALRSNVVFNCSSDSCCGVGARVSVERFDVRIWIHKLRLLVEGPELDGVKLSVLAAFLFVVAELPTLGDFAALVGHLSLLAAVDLREIVAARIGR